MKWFIKILPVVGLGLQETQSGHLVHTWQVFVGPREDIEFLQRYVASQTQYLVVKHRDGRKENLPG